MAPNTRKILRGMTLAGKLQNFFVNDLTKGAKSERIYIMKATKQYRVKGNYYGKWYFVDNSITNGSKLKEMDIALQINLDALTLLGCFLGTFNLLF